MIKAKRIILKNYCGYKNIDLDFSDGYSDIKKWAIFFGPNGIGKSNFIRAVEILTNVGMVKGRQSPRLFRQLKYHQNYMSQISALQTNISDLKMEGFFLYSDDEIRKIVIEDTYKGILSKHVLKESLTKEASDLIEWDKNNAVSGITLNELPSCMSNFSICVDADHPNNMQKFQIYKELKEPFLDFAESVYGFKCDLPDVSICLDKGIEFYTDFVLYKTWGTTVHYKSFSDGEKKIATLLSTLFKKAYKDSLGKGDEKIILIDNIEMHIYWERHMLLMNKMEEFFPDHQIICTTHSPIIIKEMPEKYLYNIEDILKKDS